MTGAFATVGNTVAQFEISNGAVLFDNDASAGVTEGGVFAEFGVDFADGGNGAVGGDVLY